jgi:hypothetical protein
MFYAHFRIKGETPMKALFKSRSVVIHQLTHIVMGMMICLPCCSQNLNSTNSSKGAYTAIKPFKFDVVSIRQNKSESLSDLGWEPTLLGYKARSVNMWQLIMTAYNPESYVYWVNAKIVNAPKWVTEDMFDVEARVAFTDLIKWQTQGNDRDLLKSALQSLLKERCRLAVHQDRAESAPSLIGFITRGTKQTGKRSAGNPHAAFDVAGAGNVTMVAGLRSRAKAMESPPAPTVRAPALDPIHSAHSLAIARWVSLFLRRISNSDP